MEQWLSGLGDGFERDSTTETRTETPKQCAFV
jgi:hypothetical protein